MVLVGGSSPADLAFEAFARKLVEARSPGLETLSLGGLPLDEQLRRLSALPRDSVVVFVSYRADSLGRSMVSRDVLRRVTQASSAPVYGAATVWLGLGIVGGDLIDFRVLGARARSLDLPDPPRGESRSHPPHRRAGQQPRVRLAGAPALGNRRGEAARGQRRSLPREDAVVGARADDPGRDRPPRRPDPPDRGPARRAAAAHRRPGRPAGGRAALPDGRRFHARLGVLETARRDVRLRVALLRAPHRATRPRSSTGARRCSTR